VSATKKRRKVMTNMDANTTQQSAARRWVNRPPGSNWGDFGENDQIGRLNLLTPHKVRQAIAEVQVGRVFCLSLPLDYPGAASWLRTDFRRSFGRRSGTGGVFSIIGSIASAVTTAMPAATMRFFCAPSTQRSGIASLISARSLTRTAMAYLSWSTTMDIAQESTSVRRPNGTMASRWPSVSRTWLRPECRHAA
jgi:hypothetical protein